VQEKCILDPHFTHFGVLSRPLAAFFGIVHLLAPGKLRFHSWKVAATVTICLYTFKVPTMGAFVRLRSFTVTQIISATDAA
jgi:hypothetical protein